MCLLLGGVLVARTPTVLQCRWSIDCSVLVHFRFYLAFENSFCKDYVSEKFFKLFGNVDVIPVVRGGFDYKRYLPSGIYVDASDFKVCFL